MQWLDKTPLVVVIAITALIVLAPFSPEPHLWEKLKMLAGGTLVRPIDVFDLAWHAAPLVVLALKLARIAGRGRP